MHCAAVRQVGRPDGAAHDVTHVVDLERPPGRGREQNDVSVTLLARRVSFISALMDGDVDFVACDFPQANRLTLHILAAVAEHERELISQRTRAALQAARNRGVKLGNPINAGECLARARAARSAQARRQAENLRPIIDQIMRSGATSLRVIAAALTARGIRTSRGSTRWHAEQVASVLRLTDLQTPAFLPKPAAGRQCT